MVILYAYLKTNGNVVACLPFRYNIEDEKVESREVVLEVEPHTTYDAIRQELLKIVDKEKQEYGKLTTDFTSGMPGVVTIE